MTPEEAERIQRKGKIMQDMGHAIADYEKTMIFKARILGKKPIELENVNDDFMTKIAGFCRQYEALNHAPDSKTE